jgi:hypothetical protein
MLKVQEALSLLERARPRLGPGVTARTVQWQDTAGLTHAM